MPIITWCRICDTIDRRVVERCKYCGSKMVETKFVMDEQIRSVANAREILKVK